MHCRELRQSCIFIYYNFGSVRLQFSNEKTSIGYAGKSRYKQTSKQAPDFRTSKTNISPTATYRKTKTATDNLSHQTRTHPKNTINIYVFRLFRAPSSLYNGEPSSKLNFNIVLATSIQDKKSTSKK